MAINDSLLDRGLGEKQEVGESDIGRNRVTDTLTVSMSERERERII